MMLHRDWLTAAIADDGLVVQLLLRLKQPPSPSQSPLPLLAWGIRQPRSRTATVAAGAPCAHLDSARCSPSTPFSWSAEGSPSATIDGFEDSSRPAAASRFKGAAANESAAGTATKRTRRKKTFAELKEEESMLLKEKIHLTKELATLQATFEEQRAKHETLKKMRVDFNLKYTEKFSANSNMMLPEESSSTLTHQRESSNIPPTLPFTTESGSFEAQSQTKSKSTEEDCEFFLPDLNMIPSED